MAKKKPIKNVKLQVEAAKASPAPPLGPSLGQAGVNIGTFVNEFNDRTKEMAGMGKVSVKLRVYEDRSYEFDVKTPLTGEMILKAAGVQKGSGKSRVSRAGTISKDKLKEIAEYEAYYLEQIKNLSMIIENHAAISNHQTPNVA